MQGHPKAKTLKTSPLVFPDLCIALFEGTSATGSRVYAASSTRERIVVASSSPSHIHTTQFEEEDNDVTPSPHNVPSVDLSKLTPSPPSSRPNKKSKIKVDTNRLALSMEGALNTLITRQPTITVDACIERLDTLGLDETDPLYKAAIDIFGHTTLLRETWLSSKPNPDLLKDWILRTATRLGFI